MPITMTGQSLSREGLEAAFLAKHASFVTSDWSLERIARTTSWTSPGGTLRVQVVLVPYEHIEAGCVAGVIGEAVQWDEQLYRRQGDTWTPAPVRVTPLKATKVKVGRKSA